MPNMHCNDLIFSNAWKATHRKSRVTKNMKMLYITFKKTKSKKKKKKPATNVRTAIVCFSLLGKYNKMSDKALIKH